jgi:hypothetical protein
MIAKEMQEHCLYIGRSQHMHEDLGTTISRGFNSWVKNLNICIPFILNSFVNLILLVLFLGLMGILLFASNVGSIIDPATLSPEELYSIMWEGFTENIVYSVLLIIVFFLFWMFVQSFFTAGAIGMAKKVSETGDTVLSDMLVSGSKNVSRFFLTIMLITLLALGGIIFMVPGALAVGDLSPLIENPAAQVQGMGVLAIGVILWGTYIIALNIVLSLTLYALVIDELEPLEALSAGFRFFRENKLDVFFTWVIFTALAFVNVLLSEYAGPGNILVSGFTSLLPIVVLQPLATVLWTRLYVSRKEKKLYDPADLLSYPDRTKKAF